MNIANEIEEISNNNNIYKYIRIIQSDQLEKLIINELRNITEIMKAVPHRNIEYFLGLYNYPEESGNNLISMQDKYHVKIFCFSSSRLMEIYKLANCNCGFTIILDKNNIVRFASPYYEKTTMISIINGEIEAANLENTIEK